jgi:hypothetical protein
VHDGNFAFLNQIAFFSKIERFSSKTSTTLSFRFLKKISNIIHDFQAHLSGRFDFFYWDCLGSIKG